jgi:hypothetical protein
MMAKMYRIIEYTGPQECLDRIHDTLAAGEHAIGDSTTMRIADADPDSALTIAFCRTKARSLVARMTEMPLAEVEKLGRYECMQSVCEGKGHAGPECGDCGFTPTEDDLLPGETVVMLQGLR